MAHQATFSPQLAGDSGLWALRSRPNQRRPRPSTQQNAQKVRDQLTLHRKPPVKDLSEAHIRTENQGLNRTSIQTKLQKPFVFGIERNGSVAEILADFCQKHKLSGVYINRVRHTRTALFSLPNAVALWRCCLPTLITRSEVEE
jgi:hypothetical protein